MSRAAPTSEAIVVHYLADDQTVTLCGKQKKTDGSGPKWVLRDFPLSKATVDCEICKQVHALTENQKAST